MAITGRTATVVENSSATSVTGTLPTDRQTGDIVVVTFGMSCTVAQFTGPGGSWVELVAPYFTKDNDTIAAYYQFDPSSAPVGSASVSGRVSAITQAWGGVNSASPVDVAAVMAKTSDYGTSLAVGGITTLTNGAMVVSGCIVDSSSCGLDTPSGMSVVGDATGGSVGRGLKVCQELRATAGGTGSRTWQTNPSTSLGLGAYMLALKPSNSITFTGSSTGVGALGKVVSKNFLSSSTATGAYSALKVVTRVFTASATATGVLAKSVTKRLEGTATATGGVVKAVLKTMLGSATATGTYAKSFIQIFTGTSTPSGVAVLTLLGRVFGRPGIVTAIVTLAGDVRARIRRT